MISFVNAKLNIGLYVTGKRPDGYHNLETIFLPVGGRCGLPDEPGHLCDVLEIVPADRDSFEMTGCELDCRPEKNLVWRALTAFRSEVADAQPVRIILDKQLPSGAGMGGGSADAAFTLMMLNSLNKNPIAPQRLAEMACNLGADVPFFLVNRPCFATGLGEILQPVELPQLNGKFVVILKPEEGISTAQAFGNITPVPAGCYLPDAVKRPIEEWAALISNDFEQSMFAIHPELQKIKNYLYDCGAQYASMTGSGSAFYGIFADRAVAEKALHDASTPFADMVGI